MPRGERLDAAGVFPPVMCGGIERRTICRAGRDRADCLGRVVRLVAAGVVTSYAWALVPYHALILVGTGPRALGWPMRALRAGQAGACSHRRVSHLHQNRDRAVVRGTVLLGQIRGKEGSDVEIGRRSHHGSS